MVYQKFTKKIKNEVHCKSRLLSNLNFTSINPTSKEPRFGIKEIIADSKSGISGAGKTKN